MKTLILFTLLVSNTLLAADKTAPKAQDNGGIVINDSLQKLMDIDGVKTIYADCKTRYPENPNTTQNKRTETILTCLWDGVKNKPDLKKKVETAYAEDAKPTADKNSDGGRSPASKEKPDIITKKTSVSTDYEKDPAVIALSKYYGDKLNEILDPGKALTKEENKKNTILAIDHRKFIELYKSELGKTIISAFTSYCLDTDPATCNCTDANSCNTSCTINKDEDSRKIDRKRNLDSLKTADLNGNSLDAMKWKACITSVPKHCANATPDEKTINQSETIKRSCLIMDYVASARKNIMLADAQNKFYDDLKKDRTIGIVSNTKEINAEKASSDALLEVSSKDIETSMEKPITKEMASMDSCYKDGAIVNIQACKQFLSTDKNANETAIAELGMRQIAQQGILEEALDSSPAKVRDYLKEEGYSDNDIQTMTATPETIEATKKEILDRYKNQKDAIVAEMAAKINSKTSSADGKIDAKADLTKIEKIRTEMTSRTDDLSGLVKFNNIVSSYLEVTTEGSKVNGRNTASLFGEVKDMNADDAKVLNKQIQQASLTAPKTDKNGSSATNLDVNTINDKFLNYKTQAGQDTKK